MPDSDIFNSSLNTLLASFTNMNTGDIGEERATLAPIESICIDTSNTRIGINTLDPSYSLHIMDGDDNSGNIYVSEINCIGADMDSLDVSSIININTIAGINLVFDVSKIDISGTIDLSNALFKPKFFIPDTSLGLEKNQLYYDRSGSDAGILMIKLA
tara:strand:- start:3815 stop:4288 length:474 start_codon:yes stop_codon:yes gene_type:complete